MGAFGTGRVFISYRRQETAWPARQLYELLCEQLGPDQVFKDIDDIDPGDDFVDKITRAVSSCDVLLALLGERWLTITDDEGQRRLDDPDDFVRLEIATALSRPDVRVIPILVDSARMPRPHELPPGLEPLVRRQAVQLSAMSFDPSRLLRAVQQTLTDMHTERADPGGAAAVEAPSQESEKGISALEPIPRGPEVEHPGLITRPRTILLSALALVVIISALLIVIELKSRQDPAATGGPPSGSSRGSQSGSTAGSDSAPPGDVEGPHVLAHRGGWEKYPLESLPALTSSARSGYAVETDVRWTADNVPVIVHDEAATKGLECTRPFLVSKTTWSELSKHCQSTPSPTDEKRYPISTYPDAMEALAAVPGAWVYVEVKVDQTPQQGRRFLEVIRDNGLSKRTVVTSFNPDYLRAVHADAADLRLMLFTTERVPVGELKREHLWGVAVSSDIATKRYVRDIKQAGVIVVDWLLNEEASWAKGRAVGADKVLTDYPNAYTAWLAQR